MLGESSGSGNTRTTMNSATQRKLGTRKGLIENYRAISIVCLFFNTLVS